MAESTVREEKTVFEDERWRAVDDKTEASGMVAHNRAALGTPQTVKYNTRMTGMLHYARKGNRQTYSNKINTILV